MYMQILLLSLLYSEMKERKNKSIKEDEGKKDLIFL